MAELVAPLPYGRPQFQSLGSLLVCNGSRPTPVLDTMRIAASTGQPNQVHRPEYAPLPPPFAPLWTQHTAVSLVRSRYAAPAARAQMSRSVGLRAEVALP